MQLNTTNRNKSYKQMFSQAGKTSSFRKRQISWYLPPLRMIKRTSRECFKFLLTEIQNQYLHITASEKI